MENFGSIFEIHWFVNNDPSSFGYTSMVSIANSYGIVILSFGIWCLQSSLSKISISSNFVSKFDISHMFNFFINFLSLQITQK